MRKIHNNEKRNVDEHGLEARTIGDSRGYLWKIIIDHERRIGKIEKVTGLRDSSRHCAASIESMEYPLPPQGSVSDSMQYLTGIIESRYQAA